MEYTVEKDLTDFDFWGGAKGKAKLLTDNEMDIVEQKIVELYPEGISDTEINELFWFDFEEICSYIGVDSEEIYNRE